MTTLDGAVAPWDGGIPSLMSVLARVRGHQPAGPFLTLHTPAGFDDFTVAAGSVASAPYDVATADDLPPDPAALAKLAASYGVEILGPPPAP